MRQADVLASDLASDNGPFSAVAWLGDAAKRARDLLEMARTGEVDVTSTPEFKRWHSPLSFAKRPSTITDGDLDIPIVRNEKLFIAP